MNYVIFYEYEAENRSTIYKGNPKNGTLNLDANFFIFFGNSTDQKSNSVFGDSST